MPKRKAICYKNMTCTVVLLQPNTSQLSMSWEIIFVINHYCVA